ncbi:MAG TPA: hypothetical protein P5571_15795, partial [Candidatus Krumholzibacteria bacterium]|nr:hypothetical protein [Candidatus Krumholzibacteria bacterium]
MLNDKRRARRPRPLPGNMKSTDIYRLERRKHEKKNYKTITSNNFPCDFMNSHHPQAPSRNRNPPVESNLTSPPGARILGNRHPP